MKIRTVIGMVNVAKLAVLLINACDATETLTDNERRLLARISIILQHTRMVNYLTLYALVRPGSITTRVAIACNSATTVAYWMNLYSEKGLHLVRPSTVAMHGVTLLALSRSARLMPYTTPQRILASRVTFVFLLGLYIVQHIYEKLTGIQIYDHPTARRPIARGFLMPVVTSIAVGYL